jgi:hypothetical protein
MGDAEQTVLGWRVHLSLAAAERQLGAYMKIKGEIHPVTRELEANLLFLGPRTVLDTRRVRVRDCHPEAVRCETASRAAWNICWQIVFVKNGLPGRPI